MSRKSEALSQRLSLDTCLMGCFQCLFLLPQVPGEKLLDWKDRTRAQTVRPWWGQSHPRGKGRRRLKLASLVLQRRSQARELARVEGCQASQTQLWEVYQLFHAAHSTRHLGRSKGMIPILKLLSLPYTHAMYIYWLAGS